MCEKLHGAWQASRVSDGATVTRTHARCAEREREGGGGEAGRFSVGEQERTRKRAR